MAKKKDGSLRLVCDLRRINQLLQPFIIQLPKIDELLNEIASQRPQMLTRCDLYKGYYSVRLSPKTSKPVHNFTWQSPCFNLHVAKFITGYVSH